MHPDLTKLLKVCCVLGHRKEAFWLHVLPWQVSVPTIPGSSQPIANELDAAVAAGEAAEGCMPPAQSSTGGLAGSMAQQAGGPTGTRVHSAVDISQLLSAAMPLMQGPLASLLSGGGIEPHAQPPENSSRGEGRPTTAPGSSGGDDNTRPAVAIVPIDSHPRAGHGASDLQTSAAELRAPAGLGSGLSQAGGRGRGRGCGRVTACAGNTEASPAIAGLRTAAAPTASGTVGCESNALDADVEEIVRRPAHTNSGTEGNICCASVRGAYRCCSGSLVHGRLVMMLCLATAQQMTCHP